MTCEVMAEESGRFETKPKISKVLNEINLNKSMI